MAQQQDQKSRCIGVVSISKAVSQAPFKVISNSLKFFTKKRVEFYRITEDIRQLVQSSNIQEGFVQLSSLHTTVVIIVNEFQDALLDDIRSFLERLVDRDGWYKHNSECKRQNADSHLRSILLNPTALLQIANGKLQLGKWQDILLFEFDGPQERRIRAQIVGTPGDAPADS